LIERCHWWCEQALIARAVFAKQVIIRKLPSEITSVLVRIGLLV
jgi:hypothetical protein